MNPEGEHRPDAEKSVDDFLKGITEEGPVWESEEGPGPSSESSGAGITEEGSVWEGEEAPRSTAEAPRDVEAVEGPAFEHSASGETFEFEHEHDAPGRMEGGEFARGPAEGLNPRRPLGGWDDPPPMSRIEVPEGHDPYEVVDVELEHAPHIELEPEPPPAVVLAPVDPKPPVKVKAKKKVAQPGGGGGRIAAAVAALIVGGAGGFGGGYFTTASKLTRLEPQVLQARKGEAKAREEADQAKQTAAQAAGTITTLTTDAQTARSLGVGAIDLVLAPGAVPTLDPRRAEEAEAEFTKVIKADPDKPAAYALRAWVRLARGADPAEVVADLEDALKRDPAQADDVVHQLAYRAYEHLGRHDEAARRLAAAFHETDQTPPAEVVTRRIDRAQRLIDRATKLKGEKPDEAAAAFEAALKSAEEAATTATKEQLDSAGLALFLKGRALEGLDRFDDAVEAFKEAAPLAKADERLESKIKIARVRAASAKARKPAVKQGRLRGRAAVLTTGLIAVLEDKPAELSAEDQEALNLYNEQIERWKTEAPGETASPLYEKGRLLLRYHRDQEALEALTAALLVVNPAEASAEGIDMKQLRDALNEARTRIAAAPKVDSSELETQVKTLTGKLTDANAKVAALEKDLDAERKKPMPTPPGGDAVLRQRLADANANVEQLKNDLEEARKKPAPTTPGAPMPAVNPLKAQLADAERELGTTKATLTATTAKLTEAETDRNAQKAARETARLRINALTSQVESTGTRLSESEARARDLARRLAEAQARPVAEPKPAEPVVVVAPAPAAVNSPRLAAARAQAAEAAFNRGIAALEQGDASTAAESFGQAGRLEPEDARALYFQGLAHDRMGLTYEAEAEWRAAANRERRDAAQSAVVSLALARYQGADRQRLERFRP